MNSGNGSWRISSWQIIILGFLSVITVGSFLLMLPWASASGEGAGPLDAVFTATSAVCVTGLVTQNTATYWSAFGQAVILALIQIGGMGVVTVALSVEMFSGKKIGLMQRNTMKEAISAPNFAGIVRLTGFILKTTVLLELLGAALMYPVFRKSFGNLEGIWYALFHSVSAFCNAGFDLLGVEEPFVSLTGYADSAVINSVIMGLIIIGGLGFLTWDDIRKNKWEIRKYRMQSKVILTMTLILIVIPAVYFFVCEFSSPVWGGASLGERIWHSLFQSVTTRTAGFNTADLTKLTENGQFITLLLMLIGGSPGSTAGGMKTTTVAVLVVSAIAVFKRRPDANLFKRRVPGEVIHDASAILLMYICLFITGGLLISGVEGVPLLTALFETASAIGTVGLSLGITPGLGAVSKIVLIGLMFFGRVGGLTLIFAALSAHQPAGARMPKEKITVG